MAGKPVCDICLVTFAKNDHLIRHLRKHTLEKPFKCATCHKSFSRRDVLQRHTRVHTSKRASTNLADSTSNTSTSTKTSKTLESSANRTTRATESHSTRPSSDNVNPLASTSSSVRGADDGRFVAHSLEILASLASGGSRPEDTSTTSPAPSLTSLLGTNPSPHSIWSLPQSSTFSNIPGGFLDQTLRVRDTTNLPLDPTALDTYFDWHLSAAPDLFSPTFLDSMPLQLDRMLFSRPPSPRLPPQQNSSDPNQSGPEIEPSGVHFPLAQMDVPLNDSASSALLDRFNFSRAITLWSNDRPMSDVSNFEVSAGDWMKPNVMNLDDGTFGMPCPEFLATSLLLYFKYLHPRHVFIHVPTFNPRHHSVICLLAMCANGARAMNTPAAVEFSNRVLSRVNLVLQRRTKSPSDLHQHIDILLCAVLVMYSGMLSGSPQALASAMATHQEAVDLAWQIRLFHSDGPSRFSLPLEGLPLNDEPALEGLWNQWVTCETTKRLAFCLIYVDTWLNVLLPDKKAPFISLSRIAIDLPCREALFSANDAQTWANGMMKPSGEGVGRLPRLLGNLFNDGGLTIPLDPLQLSTSLAILWLHYRCRVAATIFDGNAPRVVDLGMAQALHAFRHYFTPSPIARPPDSVEAFLWHLLNMWSASDFDVVEAAAGRLAASEALLHLRLHWVHTAAGRRTVLHAAQMFAAISHEAVTTVRGGPWGVYHVYGPFHAGLVLWLYSTLQGWSSSEESQSRSTFCLTDPVDWDRLGLIGMDEAVNDGDYAASQWISKGGPCSVYDEALTSPQGQVVSLLTCISSLECGAARSRYPLGYNHATILRLWMEAAMPMLSGT